MAADWIKVESVMPDKPEVFQISETLKIDPDAVIGKLIRVWIWADAQTENGNAAIVTKSLLDRVTFCAGFADAMEKAGWLQCEKGQLVFPNFERHNGQTAKNRAKTLKRVKRFRNAPSVTKALPETETETEIQKPKKVSESSESEAGQNRKRNRKSIFDSLPKRLDDLPALSAWFNVAASAPGKPKSLQPTPAGFRKVIIAAAHAPRHGDNPIAVFRTIVGKGQYDLLSKDRESIEIADKLLAKLKETTNGKK